MKKLLKTVDSRTMTAWQGEGGGGAVGAGGGWIGWNWSECATDTHTEEVCTLKQKHFDFFPLFTVSEKWNVNCGWFRWTLGNEFYFCHSVT